MFVFCYAIQWCNASTASAASCLFSLSPSFCAGLALAVSFSWRCTRWINSYFAMPVSALLISLIWNVSVLCFLFTPSHIYLIPLSSYISRLVLLDSLETEALELVETVVDLTKIEIVLDRINQPLNPMDPLENTTAVDVADADSGKFVGFTMRKWDAVGSRCCL